MKLKRPEMDGSHIAVRGQHTPTLAHHRHPAFAQNDDFFSSSRAQGNGTQLPVILRSGSEASEVAGPRVDSCPRPWTPRPACFIPQVSSFGCGDPETARSEWRKAYPWILLVLLRSWPTLSAAAPPPLPRSSIIGSSRWRADVWDSAAPAGKIIHMLNPERGLGGLRRLQR